MLHKLAFFIFFLTIITFVSTIKKYSRLEAIIDGKEIIEDMCSLKFKSEHSQIGFKLCDFIIKNFTNFAIGLCEFTAALLAGTIHCETAWLPYATKVEKRCEADMAFWKEVWCLSSKPEQKECCFKNATSASQAILPSCTTFQQTMTKLGQDVCALSRAEGLSLANTGCAATFNLLAEKPKFICYRIFEPSFVPPEGNAF
ncbi:hypothetical protein ACQ4LE_004815 [Meloidogyne hapla]